MVTGTEGVGPPELLRLGETPDVLVVTGSGLAGIAGELESAVRIGFEEVPGLPSAGVEGHPGAFLHGRWCGRSVLVQAGRFHRYEGHPPRRVAAPIRVAAGSGVTCVILTNAVGGIAPWAVPGSVVVLRDQISFPGPGPLVGPVGEGEHRFPDMSSPFDPELRALAGRVARTAGFELAEGVYGAAPGPAFETPAEIRALRALGADVVGMSTVDEVIQAKAFGMKVLGLSLVTNRAAGLRPLGLHHEEVLEGAAAHEDSLRAILTAIVGGLPPSD